MKHTKRYARSKRRIISTKKHVGCPSAICSRVRCTDQNVRAIVHVDITREGDGFERPIAFNSYNGETLLEAIEAGKIDCAHSLSVPVNHICLSPARRSLGRVPNHHDVIQTIEVQVMSSID